MAAEFLRALRASPICHSARNKQLFKFSNRLNFSKAFAIFEPDGFLRHQVHLKMNLFQFCCRAGPIAAIRAPPIPRKSWNAFEEQIEKRGDHIRLVDQPTVGIHSSRASTDIPVVLARWHDLDSGDFENFARDPKAVWKAGCACFARPGDHDCAGQKAASSTNSNLSRNLRRRVMCGGVDFLFGCGRQRCRPSVPSIGSCETNVAATIHRAVAGHRLTSAATKENFRPAITIIGDVGKLRKDLDWFEHRHRFLAGTSRFTTGPRQP